MAGDSKSGIVIFDYYELRARIVPAIMVFSPLLLSSISLSYVISGSAPWVAGSGLIVLVILYVMSFVVRFLGKRYEPELWAKWDGPPSTRFMRWSDNFFSTEAKITYHNAIYDEFGIRLKDKQEEKVNPPEADSLIMDAFRQVKSLVRIKDHKVIWNAQNAEYGALRNTLGSLSLWLIISLLGTTLCICLYVVGSNGLTLACVVANACLTLSAMLCCLLRRQIVQFTKEVADRYAELMWTSFINIHRLEKT